MKLILLLLGLTHITLAKTFSLFHFNIEELESSKLKQVKHPQLLAVKEVLSKFKLDILSINELQFDLQNVPNKNYQTHGKNLKQFLKLTDLEPLKFHSFYPANTGNYALPINLIGEYPESSRQGDRSKADPISFGLFPAQYSTALATQFPILDRFQISRELPWQQFNKSIKLSDFTDSSGQPLDKVLITVRNNFQDNVDHEINFDLFDKNFTDSVIQIEGERVHVITLHTVPAFDFGIKKSPNYQRNLDQLRFLEWYVSGSTDIEVNKDAMPIKPLNTGDHIIIVGDLNVDARTEKLGAQIIQNLLKKGFTSAVPISSDSYTHPGSQKMLLDYVLISPTIEVVEAAIISPKNFPELTKTLSQASDHYPIWANLRIKNAKD